MQHYMRACSRALAIITCVAILGACASGADIRVDKDPGADFSGFSTFSFMRPLGTDSGASSTRLSGHLIAATTTELEARGLRTVSGSADLLVNFYSGITSGIPGQRGALVKAPVRNYGGWTGYPLDAMRSSAIDEGTLIIDLVNRRTNQLVWRGKAEQRVTEAMRDDLGQTVAELVSALLAEFP